MSKHIAIIGGGPAGLMAAHQLVGKGYDVHLYDAMPSLGRKFLMAGKSGMNLTHNEDFDLFVSRYKDGSPLLKEILTEFTPSDIRNWAESLGIETFVGSSGRIFPTDFKAAPLLRSWLRHLRSNGLQTHVHHRWIGWDKNALQFETPKGSKSITPDATIIALGGVSWPELGSNGNWQSIFKETDISLSPFKPSNCGFLVNWSDHFVERFAGEPLKSIGLKVGEVQTKGDFVVTKSGVEGSAIYTHSRALREQIERAGTGELILDLTPDRSFEKLKASLLKPKGSKSISTHIKRATGLSGAKAGLLREYCDKGTFSDMDQLARSIKSLCITVESTRPLKEAISSAGGVMFNELDNNLMLKEKPGIFLAGEMLNWDAPTGGYLLTACFALGKRAGLGIEQFLKEPVL